MRRRIGSTETHSDPLRGLRDGFRRREVPPDLVRGLFTLLIDDEQGHHICQVWASTPGSAASMMAPWAKGRLRRARRHEEVPVELVGWDFPETAAELSKTSGIPEDELDQGCLGFELLHVWLAEHEVEGKTSSLYVIETIHDDQGITDEP